MKQLIPFLLVIILVGICISCKKDKLTKETQTGANTFSCKIDGNIFEPCKDVGLFTSKPLFGGVTVSGRTTASITAKCSQTVPEKYVSIALGNFQGIGEYSLLDSDNTCTYYEYNPNNRYTSALTQNGKVIITKDDRLITFFRALLSLQLQILIMQAML